MFLVYEEKRTRDLTENYWRNISRWRGIATLISIIV